jgi:hypothetical protein
MSEQPTYPSKAEFGLSPYGDGSGHRITVSYDTTDSGAFGKEIRIGEYVYSFPPEDAEAVIAAIRYSAHALLTARQKGTPDE